MAVGDTKSGLQSIGAGLYLSIQPPAGEEYIVFNVYHEGTVTLEIYDGTLALPFESRPGPDFLGNMQFRATNSRYLRIKNDAGMAKLIGYDGLQTK